MRKAFSIIFYIVAGFCGLTALIMLLPNEDANTPMVSEAVVCAAVALLFFIPARKLSKPKQEAKLAAMPQTATSPLRVQDPARTQPPKPELAQATAPSRSPEPLPPLTHTSGIADPADVLSNIMQPLSVPQPRKTATPNPVTKLTPQSDPLHLWGRLPLRIEVAGEHYHQKAFKKIFARYPNFSTYSGAEVKDELLLVPEPTNRYDRNAVAVMYHGLLLGYMPADDAAIYHAPIAALGAPLSVPGRIWASKDGSSVNARVTFDITEPQNLHAATLTFGDDEVEIPYGDKMHVIGEEQFMAALREHVPEHGEKRILVRLKKSIDFRPKSARERVDVFIGDERIGWLSDTQSTNMLPVVKLLEEHGRVGAARATIGGSVLKAEVFLYVARASEVSTEWVNEVKSLPSVQEAREAEWDW